jgi:hypothetical protein
MLYVRKKLIPSAKVPRYWPISIRGPVTLHHVLETRKIPAAQAARSEKSTKKFTTEIKSPSTPLNGAND